MPRYRVRVVASYAPTEPTGGPFDSSHLFEMEETTTQSQAVRKRVTDWVESGNGRRAVVDHEIDPPRLTATAIYEGVDAPSEWDAKIAGVALFRSEDLPEPESVVPHIDATEPEQA